jgi:uncharacterized membrane protein
MINGLLTIDLLTIFQILVIVFIPSSFVQVIFGVPFFLFFPGYTLIAALFPKKQEMAVLELIAFSCILSIAIVALTGFAMNRTVWGISLSPILYSIAIFVFLSSTIALIRGHGVFKTIKIPSMSNIRLISWGNSFQASFTILLIVFILGALGIFGYCLTSLRPMEKYSEFYILGINGRAHIYPSEFIMENGHIILTRYGADSSYQVGGWGRVILGIVNHEQQKSIYSVNINIDGNPTNMRYAGIVSGELSQIELQQGEKWEHEIEFSPQKVGDNQKVELFLYKNSEPVAEDTLQLTVNVKEIN